MRSIAVVAVFACATLAQTPPNAFDAQGNVYIAQSTAEAGWVTSPGAFQPTFNVDTCSSTQGGTNPFSTVITTYYTCAHVYVRKVTADGSTILVGTYLGGSGDDGVSAIAIDQSGNIYVAGLTGSADFPVTSGAYQQTAARCYLSELSADGRRLLHSTYLDCATIAGVAVDPQGRVLVAGSGFIQSPVQSAFLVAFSADLSSIVYSAPGAVIGGASNGTNSYAWALALDRSGNAYVVGTGGLTKLDTSGNPLWTLASASGTTLSVDAVGQAYVVGETSSPQGVPVTPGAVRVPMNTSVYPQTYALKVSADGSHLVYAALLPLSVQTITAVSLLSAVDSAGDLLIAAPFVPLLSNFPTNPASMQPCMTAAQSEFGPYAFLKLAPDGSSILDATYLPGYYYNFYFIALEPSGLVLVPSLTRQFDIVDTNARPSQGVTCVANAASYRAGAIAPGEIVSLFGPGIGPAQPAGMELSDGNVAGSLAGVQVQFAGLSAPLLYVSENQINAVVPFGVSGLSQAAIQVINQGAALPQVTVPVAASAPGIFTLDWSGENQALALNQDGSINTSDNPAPVGSTISVFVTGAGLMQPSVLDGNPGTGASQPALPISAALGLHPVVTTHVADVPGAVEGLVQVTFVAPSGATQYDELNISFGAADPNVATPARVFVSVR